MSDWEMVMTTTFIYALCEPGTRTIRYIGKSDDVKQRLRQHRCEARQGECRTHKDRWLVSLENAGLIPEILILSEVPKTEWKSEEILYIRAARMLGINLVNGTDGGDGVDGYIHTPETKAILSKKGKGRKSTKEARARMSRAKSGINHPFFGKNLSVAHRENLSKSQAGKLRSPALVAASAKTRTGKKCSGASSKYVGVCLVSSTLKWKAEWPRHKYLGCFTSEVEAYAAVRKEQIS